MLSLLSARPALDLVLASPSRFSSSSSSLLSELDSAWDAALRSPSWYDPALTSRRLHPAAPMPRLESLPDAHVVTMDTPGVAARDLALTLVGDRTLELVVSAGSPAASDRDDTEGSPRSSSSVLLRQRIALPSDADPRKIRSEYSDGRLRVEIARRSTAAHHRHITQVRDDDEEDEELVGLEASYASKRARLGELTEELRRERRELAGLESELRAARQEARRKRSSRRTLIAIERPAGEERKREEAGESEEGKDRRAGVE